MIRTASVLLGGIALTALGAGVATAAPLVAEPPTAPTAPVAGNPLWATDHVPVPVEDPTFGLFDAAAPAYALLGGIG
ncbi:hypothetical protein GCM10009836_13950 [Pseudonocardia ailaonensis]|uniref:Uncharacterized protein n=1 Tax=Pseudonocardia ailaonensis TaxID=367279 RepID=A0ABN2MSK1_9PSEU